MLPEEIGCGRMKNSDLQGLAVRGYVGDWRAVGDCAENVAERDHRELVMSASVRGLGSTERSRCATNPTNHATDGQQHLPHWAASGAGTT